MLLMRKQVVPARAGIRKSIDIGPKSHRLIYGDSRIDKPPLPSADYCLPPPDGGACSRARAGCATRRVMLSMIYKMGMSAEKSWRRLRGFRQLGKVIDGVKFNYGIEVIEDSRAVAGKEGHPFFLLLQGCESFLAGNK